VDVRVAGVLVAAVCLAASGCGGSADPGAAPRAAACPAPVVKPAAERPAPQAAVDAAAKYLSVRESWLAACRAGTTSWEAEAKRLMTARGWRTHPKDHADAAKIHGQMTRNRWNVRVRVSCMTNPEMGPAKAAWQPLFCSLTDTTVDASGKPVPAGRLPADWPFSGAQNPAPIAVTKQGGAWLVDQDLTGLAQ